jgi:hypothetical protein
VIEAPGPTSEPFTSSGPQFAATVEARAAPRHLVVVDQLVLLRVVRIRDRCQQVGEVNRQVRARDRAHHQRARALVGTQLDVAGRAHRLRARRAVGRVEGIETIGDHHVALERVGDPVRVLRTQAVEHRGVVQHDHVHRDLLLRERVSADTRGPDADRRRQHVGRQDERAPPRARRLPGSGHHICASHETVLFLVENLCHPPRASRFNQPRLRRASPKFVLSTPA